MNKQELTSKIKELALEAGFNACGITDVKPLEQNSLILKNWISHNYNADLNFLDKNFEKRINPELLVPGAKSIVICLISYNYSIKQKSNNYRISKYIAGSDYHKVIKKKLLLLLKNVKLIDNSIVGCAFVDTAPLMEKPLAMRAGLGWIGKNGLLINKDFGSFCFIGSLIINAELDYDKPEISKCGNCDLCLNACPTHAHIKPSLINLHKCIAYNTIENKGCIPENVKSNIGKWVYGCDACQEICPWNTKAKPATAPEFYPSSELLNFTDSDWENITEEQFKSASKDSALDRTTFERFKRNISTISKTKLPE
jgi:epoxyqueuosine reductase